MSQRDDRIKSLETIRAAGIDPFGGKFVVTHSIQQVLDGFQPEGGGPPVTIAGRILAIRDHGKSAFVTLRDQTGRMQAYFRRDTVGEALYAVYKQLHIGDIVGATGPVQKTKTGETTVFADGFTLLCKALLPLPEKFHGLKDVEIRYRRRYVDLIANPEVMETFQRRVRIVRNVRRFMEERNFLEVETPMMHPIPGGAAARPFITHHNALDMDLYLRIAPELYLKRLLVGGLERVYEINRNFRNEGLSPKHNPEFSMMEVYQAYGDYHDMMQLTEDLFVSLAREFHPDLKVTYGDAILDLTPPWRRARYLDLFREHAHVDWHDAPAVAAKAASLGIDVKGKSPQAIAGDVFEATVEPHLGGPIFVTEYPTAICPLAKAKRDDPAVAERFELFFCGMEMANAFTELNDPIDQRARFLRQLENRDEGMAKLDEDFLMALEHGMPPAGGLGIGIDRLVMVLTNSRSIRDVILFPLMREVVETPEAAAEETGLEGPKVSQR